MKGLLENILVVEDDDPTRRLLEESLADSGFRVLTATNGAAALRHISIEPPDLVVLDLVLPWVNGVEVLATLRDMPVTKNVPVLVITGTNTREFELRAFAPLKLMRKPLDLDDVVRSVQDLLARKAL